MTERVLRFRSRRHGLLVDITVDAGAGSAVADVTACMLEWEYELVDPEPTDQAAELARKGR